jgi:hypothetical protein
MSPRRRHLARGAELHPGTLPRSVWPIFDHKQMQMHLRRQDLPQTKGTGRFQFAARSTVRPGYLPLCVHSEGLCEDEECNNLDPNPVSLLF